MGNGRKAEDSDRFWDEAVQKRMEDVLSKNRADCLKYLREQNEILDTLDEETRTKFERRACMKWSGRNMSRSTALA